MFERFKKIKNNNIKSPEALGVVEKPQKPLPVLAVIAFEKVQLPELEVKVDANITTDIIETATAIVDKYGDGVSSLAGSVSETKSGTFILRDEINGSKIPSLKINIPVGNFADEAKWRAELSFGYQDSSRSEHILINKNHSVEVSYYNDRSKRFMDNDNATHLSDRLKELEAQVADDYIDHFSDLPTVYTE